MNAETIPQSDPAVECPAAEVLAQLRLRLAKADDALGDLIVDAHRRHAGEGTLTAALDALTAIRDAAADVIELEGFLAPEADHA